MKIEWMGRYRPFVRALVQHTNTVTRSALEKHEMRSGILLSAPEWQMLEYLIEHENDMHNMADISESLGIAQSSLSKYAKYLCGIGLVERYRMEGNRKNIILRPSDAGRDFYCTIVDAFMKDSFSILFQALEDVPDDMLDLVTRAITTYNASFTHPGDKKLVLLKDETARQEAATR